MTEVDSKMKGATQEQVTCPHCGTQLTAEVITTIHESNEEAWRALLESRLNVCHCDQCQQEFMVEKPLIYRHETQPFIVYYLDTTPETDQFALEKNIDDMAAAIADSEGVEKPIVRLTVTLCDFIEKIFIWRHGYDDRLIEYAKQQLFRNTDLDQMSRLQHRLLLDFSNEDPQVLPFIIFDRETNQPVGGIHVPLEEFLKLTDEFYSNPQLLHELELLFPSCYVSVERLF